MYENMEMPDTIDEYIARGIKKGKRKKNSIILKRTLGIIMCLALTVFIASIRVSPVLAANVAKIPGLRYIVELVRFDKGITSAIDNDYIQNIDKSLERLGIVFTVKDIIADNSGIIVFYSIENKGNYKWPHITDAKLLNLEGKELKMSSSYGYGPNEDKIYEGKIDFHSVNENGENNEIPNNVILQTKIAVNKANNIENDVKIDNVSSLNTPENADILLEGIWSVEFPISKAKFSELEKMYKINQSVEIEGQKILFDNIIVYPTKSILSVSFDKTNAKKIFAFENLKLVDEKGQEWGRISNGMTGSYPGENSQDLYFQSNYFHKPKELYITGDSIRALDKDKCYFTLDVEKKQIISPYNKISILEFSYDKDKLSFRAQIQKDVEDIHYSYQISNEALDANGNKLEITESGMGSDGTNIGSMNYTLKLNDNFKGPITFKIYDYPSKIKGSFKVRIPLNK